jgi:hypothetical protein
MIAQLLGQLPGLLGRQLLDGFSNFSNSAHAKARLPRQRNADKAKIDGSYEYKYSS